MGRDGAGSVVKRRGSEHLPAQCLGNKSANKEA